MTDPKSLLAFTVVLIATSLRLLGPTVGLTEAGWLSITSATVYAFIVGQVGAIALDGWRVAKAVELAKLKGGGA